LILSSDDEDIVDADKNRKIKKKRLRVPSRKTNKALSSAKRKKSKAKASKKKKQQIKVNSKRRRKQNIPKKVASSLEDTDCNNNIEVLPLE
jgi:hypothetical protein